jgi:hypothetical protein
VVNWLVCNRLTEGCTTESNLRDCQCGTQLWVSVLMTPLVDSGELLPRCWSCQQKAGRTVAIHPREIEALTDLGRLEEGRQIIAAMNARLGRPIELVTGASVPRPPADLPGAARGPRRCAPDGQPATLFHDRSSALVDREQRQVIPDF